MFIVVAVNKTTLVPVDVIGFNTLANAKLYVYLAYIPDNIYYIWDMIAGKYVRKYETEPEEDFE